MSNPNPLGFYKAATPSIIFIVPSPRFGVSPAKSDQNFNNEITPRRNTSCSKSSSCANTVGYRFRIFAPLPWNLYMRGDILLTRVKTTSPGGMIICIRVRLCPDRPPTGASYPFSPSHVLSFPFPHPPLKRMAGCCAGSQRAEMSIKLDV